MKLTKSEKLQKQINKLKSKLLSKKANIITGILLGVGLLGIVLAIVMAATGDYWPISNVKVYSIYVGAVALSLVVCTMIVYIREANLKAKIKKKELSKEKK